MISGPLMCVSFQIGHVGHVLGPLRPPPLSLSLSYIRRRSPKRGTTMNQEELKGLRFLVRLL